MSSLWTLVRSFCHIRYMAPEVLNCEVGPPSDMWAAGVMCYQLLSGYLPFDDRKSPRSPAISKI
jgi:serine/threonine protein kinase